MDEQNSDESVENWIARARRARELVERVDHDEVAGHDPQAIEKLAQITDELGELSQGRNVEYAPGGGEGESNKGHRPDPTSRWSAWFRNLPGSGSFSRRRGTRHIRLRTRRLLSTDSRAGHPHKWRILHSRPFDDFDEMLATIYRFMSTH